MMIARNPGVWKRKAAVSGPAEITTRDTPVAEAGVELTDAEAEFQQDYFGEHCLEGAGAVDAFKPEESSGDEEAFVPGLI